MADDTKCIRCEKAWDDMIHYYHAPFKRLVAICMACTNMSEIQRLLKCGLHSSCKPPLKLTEVLTEVEDIHARIQERSAHVQKGSTLESALTYYTESKLLEQEEQVVRIQAIGLVCKCHWCHTGIPWRRCLLVCCEGNLVCVCDHCVTPAELRGEVMKELGVSDQDALPSYSQVCRMSHHTTVMVEVKGVAMYRSSLRAVLRRIVESILLPPPDTRADPMEQRDQLIAQLRKNLGKRDCDFHELQAKFAESQSEELKSKKRKIACLEAKVKEYETTQCDLNAKIQALQRHDVTSLMAQVQSRREEVLGLREQLRVKTELLQQEIEAGNALARNCANTSLHHENEYLTSLIEVQRETIYALHQQAGQPSEQLTRFAESLDRCTANYQDKVQELHALAQKAAYADHQICVVCQDAPREVVLLFCGHFCVCLACSGKLNGKCPVCRAEVNQVSQRVYC